jgi:hypothetical protein
VNVDGVGFDNAVSPLLADVGSTSAKNITVFSTAGSPDATNTFGLASASNWCKTVYGFTLNIDKNTTLNSSSISFKGEVLSLNLGAVQSIRFPINEFTIGTNDLAIKKISLQTSNAIPTAIAGWSATFSTINFGINGFKIGGNITVKIPGTPDTKVDFTNLSLGRDALFGGDFNVKGLNIFGFLGFTQGSTPFSFGRVGTTGNIYRISGSGVFQLPFFDKLNVPNLQIQTDGNVSLMVPVNKTLPIPFGTFDLQSITINTINKYLGLNGKFGIDVPMMSLSAGEVKIKSSGFPEFSKIGASLDVPGFSSSFSLDIRNNGFAGSGSLGIGSVVKVDVAAHYYKSSNGEEDFGIDFAANTRIPIGIIEITRVGGGFEYNGGKLKVHITGGVAPVGMGDLIKIEPIDIWVSSGLVFEGSGALTAFDMFKGASCRTILDIPNTVFTMQVSVDVAPLKDFAQAHLGGTLILSGKAGNAFAFLGTNMSLKVLGGLVDTHGEFAAAVNLKNPRTNQATAQYLSQADGDLIGDVFSGVYTSATSSIGVDEAHAWGADFKFFSIKAWAQAQTNFGFLLNFADNALSVKLGGKYGMGGKVSALILHAGLGGEICFALKGGYNAAQGWNFNGMAAGSAWAEIGCSAGCNEVEFVAWVVPCGFKLCGGAKLNLSYAQKGSNSGLHIGFEVDGNPRKCP